MRWKASSARPCMPMHLIGLVCNPPGKLPSQVQICGWLVSTLFFTSHEQASRTVFLVQELVCLLAIAGDTWTSTQHINGRQTENHLPGSTAVRRGPAEELAPRSSSIAELSFLGQQVPHDNCRSMMARESACASCRKD